VAPAPVEEPAADWLRAALPGTAAVYRDHAVVWHSARELFGRGRVHVPEDVADVIEAVYPRGGPPAPGSLGRNQTEAQGRASAGRSLAGANLLRVESGYGGEHDGWDEDDRVATRLGEPTVVVRLARWDGVTLTPWCHDDDERRAWALSEVNVRASRIAGVPEPSDQQLSKAVAAAWVRWTRHDEAKLLLPLVELRDDLATGSGLNRSGELLTVGYNRRFGLRLPSVSG
jgi:CRISPR-associated endonuclease/helicase Cas3